jgi:hypothetical protein
MTAKLLLLAALFAAAQANSDFRNCFCFESSGNWCGANQNNDFWRDSCKNWATDALLWTIPAFLLWIGFFLFPFFFFAARMCCNCCGGRQASEGVCCPSTPSVRVFEDGHEEPIPRRYNNRSIFCTKFFFCACFGLWIYYSVGVFVLNHRVNDALNDVTGNIATESSKISDLVFNALNATQNLVSNNAPFLDAGLVSDLKLAQIKYQTVDDDIHNIVRRIQHVENDQQWGRNQDAYRIPAIGLCILVPAFFLMLCNCRNAALTIGAGLMSFTGVLVVTAFIGHELLAQASTALCNDYNDTLVPSVMNAAKWGHGCGGEGVTNDMNQASLEYFTEVCKQGLASLCSDAGFTCPPNAYEDLCANPTATGESGINGWDTLAQLLNTTFETSLTFSDVNCNSVYSNGCTMSQCASYCTSGSSIQTQSMQVTNFMNTYSEDMNQIVGAFYPAYVNCTALYEALMSTDIHGELCNDFSTKFTNISIQFLALSCLNIAAVILLILGAKRFMKMDRVQEESTRGSTFAYRVLLQSDQERAVMGSPLLGNNASVADTQSVIGYPVDRTSSTNSGPYGSVQQAAPLGCSATSMCTVPA